VRCNIREFQSLARIDIQPAQLLVMRAMGRMEIGGDHPQWHTVPAEERRGLHRAVTSGSSDWSKWSIERDNGIGMAPEMLPRIFDLFTQAKRAGARSPGGLGIGLALVRSLVGLHGGSDQALSEGHGKGSEFIVWLPKSPKGRRQGAST
jgi:nitrogen-specific signal transduction histidine kinase